MAETKEMINHPKYYNIEGRKECIEEMIDKWGKSFAALWCEMTAYKYEYRAGRKDNNSAEQDNEKREWYLNKAEELNGQVYNNFKNMKYIALHYGFDAQSNQTIEECGELIQALAKLNRSKNGNGDISITEKEAREKVIEELANVWYTSNNADYQRTAHYNQSRYHGLNLHSTFTKGTVEFRLFNGTTHAGKIKAYTQFCLAISHQALTQKKASARRTTTDNEKYAFRCWLLRLGLIGDEFKTCRLHLLANLEGNSAWRYGH